MASCTGDAGQYAEGSPPGQHTPHDLVSVLDQQEAAEDAEAAAQNGGVAPGTAEDYAMQEVPTDTAIFCARNFSGITSDVPNVGTRTCCLIPPSGMA